MLSARQFYARIFALVFVFANPYVVTAQAPTSTQAASVAPAAAAPATGSPVTADSESADEIAELAPHGYTYNPEGRRDPFTSLIRRGGDTPAPSLGSRPAGLGGLETSEVTLKGTVASEGSYVGILLGVDSKTYIVKPGDRLLDGTIRTISQDSLVVTQQVTDPLSQEKQRDVRKLLRQTEEGK